MKSKRDKAIRRGLHTARHNFDAGRDRRQGSANWKQSRDHYLALAETAISAGDVIEAEYYYQHAEHYLRLMQQGA